MNVPWPLLAIALIPAVCLTLLGLRCAVKARDWKGAGALLLLLCGIAALCYLDYMTNEIIAHM